ncbi:MAG: HEAT repeat domain-containing protein, partial [Planctomycetota bacterium]
LSEIEAQQFLETFLNFLLKMNIENITQFSANFSAIPFFKAAIMRKNYESEQLLRYLFFIYSSYLNLENKIKLLKDILESEKNIVSNSTYLENLPYHFIDMLVRLEIKSDSGLLFVLDVVDKKGRPELISNLPKIYQNSSPAIKSKINEIFLKHSLKSIVSDEKRDLNINAFVEILKKLPDSVSGEIISLIYNASASIKIRLINIIELLNFDRGIEKIIERLVYREKDKKVKATCIRLLKLLDQETALKHLRILLFDDEPRVRANAIEAFEYFATADNWFVLLALANDSNNRVRANVAKAIFPFSRTHSIEILNGMLNSDRELFVLSALWVIEKLSLYNEFTQTLEKLNRKSVGIKIRNKLNKIFTQIMKVKTSD